jgi:hypothetical protein
MPSLIGIMQELKIEGSTPRNDGSKYIVRFCSKIDGEDNWFSIVMPVQASDMATVRWCSIVCITEIRKPRSHPVPFVKIPKAIIYIGDMENSDLDNVLNLPSEWSPSRPRVQPWTMGQVLASARGQQGCRRQQVKNLILTVPRTYNIQDPNANREYFYCSFEREEVSPEVIDLTGDSDFSESSDE